MFPLSLKQVPKPTQGCRPRKKSRAALNPGNPAISQITETRGFPPPPWDGFGFFWYFTLYSEKIKNVRKKIKKFKKNLHTCLTSPGRGRGPESGTLPHSPGPRKRPPAPYSGLRGGLSRTRPAAVRLRLDELGGIDADAFHLPLWNEGQKGALLLLLPGALNYFAGVLGQVKARHLRERHKLGGGNV